MYWSEFDLSGIHIRSRPVVPDEYNLAWTIEITPTVILWMSEVSLNHKILLRTLIFTCVLITSHPLKTFRITENKTQLLYGMKWYINFVRHLWWYSIFQERIAGPVFMLLTASTFHFVKNCFQGPFAENVTALIKIWCFLKGILPPLAEKMSTSCCLLRGKT